jgi:hypothetical protein
LTDKWKKKTGLRIDVKHRLPDGSIVPTLASNEGDQMFSEERDGGDQPAAAETAKTKATGE